MTRCRYLVLLVALSASLGWASPARAQTIDPSFRAEIVKLLEATGSLKLGAQMAQMATNTMLNGIRQQQPQTPERAVAIIKEVFDKEFGQLLEGPDSPLEDLIAVYAKHFTEADVRGLNAFYATDLGKRTIAVMPQVTQEAADIGQRWAQRRMPDIIQRLGERLRAEGLLK